MYISFSCDKHLEMFTLFCYVTLHKTFKIILLQCSTLHHSCNFPKYYTLFITVSHAAKASFNNYTSPVCSFLISTWYNQQLINCHQPPARQSLMLGTFHRKDYLGVIQSETLVLLLMLLAYVLTTQRGRRRGGQLPPHFWKHAPRPP